MSPMLSLLNIALWLAVSRWPITGCSMRRLTKERLMGGPYGGGLLSQSAGSPSLSAGYRVGPGSVLWPTVV